MQVALIALLSALCGAQYLQVNPNTVTVSGISSGAFFAVQYHIAFSSLIRGAGIVAGGPYGCASGSLIGAEGCLSNPRGINVPRLVRRVQRLSREGAIDPIRHLANQTLHLFSGTGDTVVPQATMKALVKMYQALGASHYLTKNFATDAEHSWVTDMYGNSCTYLGSPYVNDCGYDFGGTFLERAFTNMGISWDTNKGTLNIDHLYDFNQVPYGADPEYNSIDNAGYIYVPSRCFSSECHLHVNFHGCNQGRSFIGDTYVTETELNEWAETNGIIILYPQVTKNDVNPEGCWDWWGYDNPWYTLQNGTEMAFVHVMVTQLIAGNFPAPTQHVVTPSPPPTEPPQPTGTHPPSCQGLPVGTTCINSLEYIDCPGGYIQKCLDGMTCDQLNPGAAICEP